MSCIFIYLHKQIREYLNDSIWNLCLIKWFIYLFCRYTTTVRVSEQQPYQVREYVWCLNFPPRCSKYKIKFKTVYKIQNLSKTRPVEDCCKGYAKSSSEDKCVAVCAEQCLHGTCIAPDTCKCETGYGGPTCDICKYFQNCFFENKYFK